MLTDSSSRIYSNCVPGIVVTVRSEPKYTDHDSDRARVSFSIHQFSVSVLAGTKATVKRRHRKLPALAEAGSCRNRTRVCVSCNNNDESWEAGVRMLIRSTDFAGVSVP